MLQAVELPAELKPLVIGVLQRDGGRVLPAALAAEGVIELQVTVTGARYPVTIDPLLTEEAKLTASDPVEFGGFGHSVALSASGKTALAGTLIFTPRPVRASHVKCGDILTKDTKLDSDLMDCPGDGLIIGKDGIEVDLNGHTIDGMGMGVGIRNPGHEGVEIKNGVIKDFEVGVLLEEPTGLVTEDNDVHGLRIETSGRGIWLNPGEDNEIEENIIVGTFLVNSFGIQVEPNSEGNEIEDNSIVGWDIGIKLHGKKNRVKENEVFNNVVGSGNAIDVEGDRNLIEKNLAAGIGFDNNTGYGIKILGKGNVVKENTTAENDKGGIFVEAGSEDTLIKGNTANHNDPLNVTGGDGIRIDAPETTVKKNITCNNGDLGIQAVPGVDDDGGNKAKGNGNPAQCSMNVKCSTKTNCQSSSAKLNSDTMPESQASPEQSTLVQNYPNPFNPETEIRFRLPEAGPVVVKIYNLFGQEIRTLVDKTYPAGHHSVRWDGRDNFGKAVSSGVYFYRLQAGSFMQVKKMNLLR
jgi:parallel beta-helix repeat protein